MTDVSDVELGTAEFKGYVKRALESIDKKLESVDAKMDGLDKCVSKMKVRVAAIGGTVSLAVTILALLIRELVSK